MSEELIHVYRGPVIENIHRGDIVVADYKGIILKSVGDPVNSAISDLQQNPFLL